MGSNKSERQSAVERAVGSLPDAAPGATVARSRDGGVRIFKRKDGAWCLGSACFKAVVNPVTGKVDIKFRAGDNCPAEMGELIQMFKIAVTKSGEVGQGVDFGVFENEDD